MTGRVEHHRFVEMLPGEVRYACFAHGDDRGGEVENEGAVLVRFGHRKAEGIRAKACFGAAVGRDERAEVLNVHEVH